MQHGKGISALGTLLALLCLGVFAAAPLEAGQGSDNGFGYTWIDSNEPGGPTVAFQSFDGSPSTEFPGGADWSTTVNLPFNFPFYGQRFNQLFITDNGFATFDLASGLEPINKQIPLGQTPSSVLAPFWDGEESALNTIQYGAIDGGTGYWFSMVGDLLGFGGNPGTERFNVDLILWNDGRIRFQYHDFVDNGDVSIGIESFDNQFGIENLFNGIGPSSGLTNGYVIEYTPPVGPNCADAVPISCNEGPVPSNTPASPTLPPASIYSCSGVDMMANERIFQFEITETSDVQATLSDLGGRDLRLFLIDQCNSLECTQGDASSLNLGALAPGTYTLVVDGPTSADEGSFSLELDCTTISNPASCQGPSDPPILGDTNGGTNSFNGYGCGPQTDHGGNERLYDVNLPAGGQITAELLSGSADLDVFILPAGSLDPANCLDGGDRVAAAFNLPPGDYPVIVDGPVGAEGPFELQINCGSELDCSAPQPTVIDCGTGSISDTIQAGPGTARKYSCNDEAWLGGEHVYALDIVADTGLTLRVDSPDGVGAFIVENTCDEGDCLGGNETAACQGSLAAGDYFLVVDAPTDAGGSYTITANCIPQDLFSHWGECEWPHTPTSAQCGLPTSQHCGRDTPLDLSNCPTVAQQWGFSDCFYCVDCGCGRPGQPACAGGQPHRNNDGTGFDGCAFAMYAVVECGTEMHLPLFDVEAGRMRVYDVLNDRYVNLIGETPTWTQGPATEIQWADSGCTDGDPCTAGADGRFNVVTNDIHFFNDDDPGTAPVCGIFRMEFYDWGGFEWDLFANCLGNNQPRFDIYDNLCEALDAYQPRAELSILNPTDNGACPDPTLDFEVTNSGCVSAENFKIRVYEETPTGDELRWVDRTDCSLAPQDDGGAQEFIPVSRVAPGETLSFTTKVCLSSSASPTLRLEVDADDDVQECSEEADVATACKPQEGRHTFRFPVCADCAALPEIRANPARVCVGGDVTLDMTGSQVATCAAGTPLEYNWTTTPTPPAQGDPGWTTSSTFPVTNVQADATWYGWVRCQNDPTCFNNEPMPVDVTVHEPPVLTDMTATDLDICDNGLRLDWAAAEFFHDPANGSGVYNIFRAPSTGNPAADCAAALGSPAVASGLGSTFLQDFTTTANETYVYVVQAEDREPMPADGGAASCPRGPSTPEDPFTGVASALCLVPPIWDEVDRTAPDNDVGNSLVVGKREAPGPDPIVTFAWADPRVNLTRERFRLLRSDVAPYGPYSVVSDQVDALMTEDPMAPAVLYFYEVRTVDTCLNVAADAFPPDRTPPATCGNLTLTCGATLEASTGDCVDDFNSHDCFARDASGPDRLHSIRFDQDYAQVTLTLGGGLGVDLYVYDAALQSCVNQGDDSVTLFDVTAGERFWVIVDGGAGEAGAYTLETDCQ